MALLGRLQPTPNNASAPLTARQPRAPGTHIGYDPLLIERLRHDHQRMLDLFTLTQVLLTTHDYDGVRRKLGELRITLQDHLMTANVKLYVYVSRQLADDAAKTAIINGFRRDMLNNSRQIMDFLRTYSAVRLDDSFADVFQVELLVIGAALVQRIEREQTSLFPLYQASY
ncbi:MAG TPA: hemerythrin domain-containing protein [Acidiferrobacterales bacterium]|nr:hemerythrin domain-containing protein [Acidiferrobacterales bacterium]